MHVYNFISLVSKLHVFIYGQPHQIVEVAASRLKECFLSSVTGQNEYVEAPYTATQLENGVRIDNIRLIYIYFFWLIDKWIYFYFCLIGVIGIIFKYRFRLVYWLRMIHCFLIDCLHYKIWLYWLIIIIDKFINWIDNLASELI